MATGEKSKIRYDASLLKLMSFFESLTGAKLRDCFVDQNELLFFVIEPAQMGLAIGRGGANVRKIEERLKRKIKVVEFSDDLSLFVSSLIHPSKAASVVLKDGIVTITAEPASRGYVIGRGGQNLRNYESIIKRYFPITELKVA